MNSELVFLRFHLDRYVVLPPAFSICPTHWSRPDAPAKLGWPEVHRRGRNLEPIDIDRLRHAAISNPADDPLQHMMVRDEQGLRPGGFGLAITRSLVDELIYNEARNEVVFVKYLDEPKST